MLLSFILSFFIFAETLPPIKIHDFFSENVCILVKTALIKKSKKKLLIRKRKKVYKKVYFKKRYRRKTKKKNKVKKIQKKKSLKNLTYCTLLSIRKFKNLYLAIALKSNKKYILFNGSLYKEGDFILIDKESYKILEISLDKVILEKDGKCYILPVSLKLNS